MTKYHLQGKPRAPAGLSAAMKSLWKDIGQQFDLDSWHYRLLEQAARSYDRAEQCRAICDKKGLTIEDRYGKIIPRPESLLEKQNRDEFARLLKQLDLDADLKNSVGGQPGYGKQRYAQ